MYKWAVVPGTISLTSFALKLMPDNVTGPHDWMMPVFIKCTKEDIKAFVELACAEGFNVTYRRANE